jgi:hypothetical protein
MPSGSGSNTAPAPDGSDPAAVLEVLARCRRPIPPRDVHAAVERRLGQPISKDTVGSYLSVAARTAAAPVIRAGPGLYALMRVSHTRIAHSPACAGPPGLSTRAAWFGRGAAASVMQRAADCGGDRLAV